MSSGDPGLVRDFCEESIKMDKVQYSGTCMCTRCRARHVDQRLCIRLCYIIIKYLMEISFDLLTPSEPLNGMEHSGVSGDKTGGKMGLPN